MHIGSYKEMHIRKTKRSSAQDVVEVAQNYAIAAGARMTRDTSRMANKFPTFSLLF